MIEVFGLRFPLTSAGAADGGVSSAARCAQAFSDRRRIDDRSEAENLAVFVQTRPTGLAASKTQDRATTSDSAPIQPQFIGDSPRPNVLRGHRDQQSIHFGGPLDGSHASPVERVAPTGRGGREPVGAGSTVDGSGRCCVGDKVAIGQAAFE